MPHGFRHIQVLPDSAVPAELYLQSATRGIVSRGGDHPRVDGLSFHVSPPFYDFRLRIDVTTGL